MKTSQTSIHFRHFPFSQGASLWEAASKITTAYAPVTSIIPTPRFPPKNRKREAPRPSSLILPALHLCQSVFIRGGAFLSVAAPCQVPRLCKPRWSFRPFPFSQSASLPEAPRKPQTLISYQLMPINLLASHPNTRKGKRRPSANSRPLRHCFPSRPLRQKR